MTGITATYKIVNNPGCSEPDVVALREAHAELDRAVLSAYGWDDIDPDHGHYDTAQGVRYTVSDAARDEILDRLLELNHQRHADEVAAGIATPKGTPARTAGKRGRKKATTDTGPAPGTVAAQSTLFGDEDDT